MMILLGVNPVILMIYKTYWYKCITFLYSSTVLTNYHEQVKILNMYSMQGKGNDSH